MRESDFYFEDNVLVFFGQKGPKKRFLNFYQKKDWILSEFFWFFPSIYCNLKNDLFLEKSFFKSFFEFFFSGKSLFEVSGTKRTWIGSKWGFQVLRKINTWNFPDSLQEGTVKIDVNEFLGEIMLWRFFWPRMKFSKCYEKPLYRNCLIFSMTLQRRKGSRSIQIICWGNLLLWLLGVKWPKTSFFFLDALTLVGQGPMKSLAHLSFQPSVRSSVQN